MTSDTGRSGEPLAEVAAQGFGAGADAYERGRPGYPADVVEWLCEHVGIGPGRDVLDLAAGTGKLTRLLLRSGARLVAVEPVEEMRAQFRQAVADVEIHDGTADAIPLADGSVDAVTVAQAFHWFDRPEVVVEIGRVLRPDGGLGLVFNERDVREPWVAELSRLIRWDERQRWRVPYTVETDWSARLIELGGPFAEVERYDTTYRQTLDPDTIVDRVLSTSYIARQDDEAKARLAGQVRDLVAPLGPSFELPYVTVAYATHRTG